MIQKNIDRKVEALQALRSAYQLDDKKSIVINVLECLLKTFNNLDSSYETPEGSNADMISRTQFVHVMNYLIDELKQQ